MIPSSSKFFYALGALLLVMGFAYGYSTGGGEVGPISFGYKGAVGDLLGYSILMGAGAVSLFVGFVTTAFREADPEAGAELLGLDHDPMPSQPGVSYWPVIGAFGAGLTVVGVALNNVFFVAGLIALGAVAVEWTMQAWADRATGDPAVNHEIRNRIMMPIEVPVGGVLAIAVVVGGFSRLFLAISAEAAVWAALAVAALVFGLGALLASRPQLRSDLVAGLLAVGAVAAIGIGIASAVAGERDFEHHGEEHGDESVEETEDGEPEGAADSEEAPVSEEGE